MSALTLKYRFHVGELSGVGLWRDEARELIKQVGNDREKLNAAAEKRKKR